MRNVLLLLVLTGFVFLSCGGSGISVNKMLEISGQNTIPKQADYPDVGGVVLYEATDVKLGLDSNYEFFIKKNYQQAVVYFSDKAESWATETIYLDDNRTLLSFSATTTSPDGKVLKLTEKDLFPASNSGFNELSEDKSVKFTFPGVEPGAILEYNYSVNIHESFYSGDTWYIQQSLPKLYTRYQIDIPDIFFIAKLNWYYSGINTELERPKIIKNIATQNSNLNRACIYTWERRDVPALEKESYRPPYRDIAQFARFDVEYESWNEWSANYWKRIKPYFSIKGHPEVVALAEKLTQGAENEKDKIARIFAFTQEKFRYIETNFGDGGYIPNSAQDILKNQYGDCKDMTVLNVLLLNACGIDAFPALLSTRGRCTRNPKVISMDFNHMITFVKAANGDEYWLDATGSSCPVGEIYASDEDVDGLVIYKNGKSEFIHVPPSAFNQNLQKRQVDLYLKADGSTSGHAVLTFSGNENLAMRSLLKNANETDMKKIIERYVNSNVPDMTVTNLVYDDANIIDNDFVIEFDFERSRMGSRAGDLQIF